MKNNVPEPISIHEKYLHATVVRLDAICHMMTSLLEYIAKKEQLGIESNVVVETKKRVKKEE